MPLSIAHLSFSSSGGAGGVASRLAAEQRRRGLNAQVIAAITGSLRDSPLQRPLHSLAAAIDEYVIKSRRFPAPISLLRDQLGYKLAERVKYADLLHIHWPHGLVKLTELQALANGRPVVWTLHDMAAVTTVCHYALDCGGCWGDPSNCQAVRPPFTALSRRHLQTKQKALSGLPDLRLVSPSRWLAEVAEKSPVVGQRPVAVIPNPLPPATDEAPSREALRHKLGIARNQIAFGVVVADTRDPLKSVDFAVEAFRRAFPAGCAAKLIVAGRNPRTSEGDVVWLGQLNRHDLSHLYSALDFLVVPSLAENQPLTIAEAQAKGTSVLVRNTTGMPEHLDIDTSGGTFHSVADCASLMTRVALRLPGDGHRQKLADAAAAKFNPSKIHLQYLEVYRQHGQP